MSLKDCLVLDDLRSFLFLVQLFDASSFGEIFDSVSTLCCERWRRRLLQYLHSDCLWVRFLGQGCAVYRLRGHCSSCLDPGDTEQLADDVLHFQRLCCDRWEFSGCSTWFCRDQHSIPGVSCGNRNFRLYPNEESRGKLDDSRVNSQRSFHCTELRSSFCTLGLECVRWHRWHKYFTVDYLRIFEICFNLHIHTEHMNACNYECSSYYICT